MGKFRPSIPLSQEELEKKGIWDFNHLSQPYIMDTILQDKFGSIWMDVASTYFNKNQYQRYEFKEEYATEKKILSKLKENEETPEGLMKAEKLKKACLTFYMRLFLLFQSLCFKAIKHTVWASIIMMYPFNSRGKED
jgi:4-alpha-glucanotransferase